MRQDNPIPPGYSSYGPDFTRVQQQKVASNSITNANIRSVSLNKLTGETLILGGTDDIKGVISTLDGTNTEILKIDKAGLTINGSVKTAIVPTSQGYNALYCIESANIWFVDFCVGKRKRSWKFWRTAYTYEVDKLFAETIEPPYFFLPTTQKGIFQVWGRRKGYASHRLETKTQGDFEQNNQFWQQPK